MLELIDKGACTAAHPAPLLFVHGGWHAAWCWDAHFLDFFADKGFRAAAVSLRGHGGSSTDKPLDSCSVSDYVDDVRSAADKLGGAPVVVGHSLGGHVMQSYLETNEAPAGVLIASAPPQGAMASSLRMLLRHPWAVLKVQLLGETQAVVGTAGLVREHLFCGETPQAIVDDCVGRLQPESAQAMKQMMPSDSLSPNRVSAPVLVLGAADDGMFNRGEVTATADAYRTVAAIFPHMGHNMMLEPGWQTVAERIHEWPNERGL